MQWDTTTSECVTKEEFTERCESNSFCFAAPEEAIAGYLFCRCTGLIIPEHEVIDLSPAVVLKGDDECCKGDLVRDYQAKECVERKVLEKRCESEGGKIKDDEKCKKGAVYCKPGDDKKLVLQT